jgi:two-component system, NtrC family, sensor kinase
MSLIRSPGLMSIPARLLAFVVLPVVIVLTLSGLLVLQSLGNHLERRLQREVEMVARALQMPVSHAMRRGDQGDVRRALDSTLHIGRVYGASVFDNDGELVVAVGGGGSSSGEVTRIMDEGQRTGAYRQVAGRRVYSYFVPLTGPGNRIVGLLQVTRTRRDMDRYMHELRWRGATILASATTTVVLVVLLGYYLALGRALQRFRQVIRGVQAGRRDTRMTITSPREVALLAAAFNDMLDSIDDAEADLQREQKSRLTLESRLRHAEKLAAIGELAAGVAHELGTPLSIVEGCCQRALRAPDLSPATQEALERSRQEVRRMERIVRQLLDYGRAEPRDRKWVEVSWLMTLSAASVRDEAAYAGIALTMEGPSGCRIHANPPRLEQALLNILKNAVHAASRRVEVSWLAVDAGVHIHIDDDGPGIPAADRRWIFLPFQTTKRSGEGTGLGLAIAQAAVAEHDGTIEVGSSPLGGARFTVAFPAAPPAPAGESTRPG